REEMNAGSVRGRTRSVSLWASARAVDWIAWAHTYPFDTSAAASASGNRRKSTPRARFTPFRPLRAGAYGACLKSDPEHGKVRARTPRRGRHRGCAPGTGDAPASGASAPRPARERAVE